MPELLKPAEAAKYLAIGEKLLKWHVERGELLAVDVGRGVKKRRLRYDPADLDAFKSKRKTSARPCQSGNVKTESFNSISGSNVIALAEALASGKSAPPKPSSSANGKPRSRHSQN